MNGLIEQINQIFEKAKLKKITKPEENKQSRYADKEIKRNQKNYPSRMIFADDENQIQKNKFIEVKNNLQSVVDIYLRSYIDNEKLNFDIKLGLAFNVSKNFWIMISNNENSKASVPTSTYILIDIIGDYISISNDEYIFKANNLKCQIGQGISGTTITDRYNNRIAKVNQFKSIVGKKLDNDFQYVESEDEDTGIIIQKDTQDINNFEKDLKSIVDIYLKFLDSTRKVGSDRKILINNDHSIDYIFDNYLKDLEDKYYSLITIKADYKLFLDDLGLIIKKAINDSNNIYYLVIDRIDSFPIEYLQELSILLNRRFDTKVTKYGLNNSYLSKIIYKKDDKKIYLPKNLYVIATSYENDTKVYLEKFFDKLI